MPVINRPTSLRIDDKPETKYHEGNIVTEIRQDLLFITDSKGAIDIAHAKDPSKRTKHLDVRHNYLQQQVHKRVL